jgi:N12 class adenine-specific DNA methylase/predicted RNA methylase
MLNQTRAPEKSALDIGQKGQAGKQDKLFDSLVKRFPDRDKSVLAAGIRKYRENVQKGLPPSEKPMTIDDIERLGNRWIEENQHGYLETIGKGLVRGTEGLLSGVGSVGRWAGDVTNIDTLSEAGESFSDYWEKAASEGWAAPGEYTFSGTFMENPSFKRAFGIVAEAMPSLGAAIVTSVATGNPLAGAGLLGLLEGAPQYEEAREEGKGELAASGIGLASTAGTTLLEYIPISRILRRAGAGSAGKEAAERAIKRIAKGGAEEGLQEASQTLWQNTIAKIGYDNTQELTEGIIESIIGGAGAGGISGAVVNRSTVEALDKKRKKAIDKAKKAGATDEEIKAIEEDLARQTAQAAPQAERDWTNQVLGQMDDNEFLGVVNATAQAFKSSDPATVKRAGILSQQLMAEAESRGMADQVQTALSTQAAPAEDPTIARRKLNQQIIDEAGLEGAIPEMQAPGAEPGPVAVGQTAPGDSAVPEQVSEVERYEKRVQNLQARRNNAVARKQKAQGKAAKKKIQEEIDDIDAKIAISQQEAARQTWRQKQAESQAQAAGFVETEHDRFPDGLDKDIADMEKADRQATEALGVAPGMTRDERKVVFNAQVALKALRRKMKGKPKDDPGWQQVNELRDHINDASKRDPYAIYHLHEMYGKGVPLPYIAQEIDRPSLRSIESDAQIAPSAPVTPEPVAGRTEAEIEKPAEEPFPDHDYEITAGEPMAGTVAVMKSGRPYTKKAIEKLIAKKQKAGNNVEPVQIGQDQYGWRYVDEFDADLSDLPSQGATEGPVEIDTMVTPAEDRVKKAARGRQQDMDKILAEEGDYKPAPDADLQAEAVRGSNFDDLKDGKGKVPREPGRKSKTDEFSPENLMAEWDRQAREKEGQRTEDGGQKTEDGGQQADLEKMIQETGEAMARAADRGDQNAVRVFEKELQSLREKYWALPGVEGESQKAEDGGQIAEGRGLFSAAQLKEFDRLGIDVSEVTAQYKNEALQQLKFARDNEKDLASPDYNRKVKQSENRAAKARGEKMPYPDAGLPGAEGESRKAEDGGWKAGALSADDLKGLSYEDMAGFDYEQTQGVGSNKGVEFRKASIEATDKDGAQRVYTVQVSSRGKVNVKQGKKTDKQIDKEKVKQWGQYPEEIRNEVNRLFPDLNQSQKNVLAGLYAGDESVNFGSLKAVLGNARVGEVFLNEYPEAKDFDADQARQFMAEKGRELSMVDRPDAEGQAEGVSRGKGVGGLRSGWEVIEKGPGGGKRTYIYDDYSVKAVGDQYGIFLGVDQMLSRHPDLERAQRRVEELVKSESETPSDVSTQSAEPSAGEQAAPAKTEQAQKPGYGESNKVFTKDAADKARELLRKKLGQVSMGLDPEIVQAGIQLAGYHIEAGARSFAAYSKAMIADLGDAVKPYLRSWYEAVRHYPGFNSEGMTAPADIEAEAKKLDKPETAGTIKPEASEPKTEEEADDTTKQLRPATEKEPAGEGPGSVSQAEEGGGPGQVLSDEGTTGSRTDGQPSEQGVPGLRGTRDSDTGIVRPVDYRIADTDGLGQGGPKAKFSDNLAAIRLAKEIKNRPATPEDQKVLVKYVGWGGLPQAFQRPDGSVAKGWEKEAAQLKELLTDEEYAAARSSTQNAHYTSQPVIQKMYEAVGRLGFDGGKILEPSIGTGHFVGLMPKAMHSKSHVTGVEIDGISARIAQLLYPTQNIVQAGFQDFVVSPESYDLVIGNPPFGSKTLYDPQHKDLKKFSIHNYFFARSLKALKPDGILAMVVSSHMMDKKGGAQREWINRHGELLGAIRLPNNAFKQTAGTEVTTDIIFLRKRRQGEPITGHKWQGLKDVVGNDGVTYRVNEYFANNPEMMLGELGPNKLVPGEVVDGVYNAAPGLIAKGQWDKNVLDEAIARLPENIFKRGKDLDEIQAPEAVVSDLKFVQPYGYTLDDNGQAVRRLPDKNGEQVYEPVLYGGKPLEGRRLERFKGIIRLRNAVRQLIRAEVSDDPKMESYRKRLNGTYDAFVKEFGYINDTGNVTLMKDDSIDFPLLRSLEADYDKGISKSVAKKTGQKPKSPSAKKAAIFSVRTREPYHAIDKAEGPNEALTVVLREDGYVNMPRIAKLYGVSEEQAAKDLSGLIFKNPSTEVWETPETYLSGNVKKKYKEARQAARRDPAFEKNVEALEKVLPKDVPPEKIFFRMGATWMPTKVYEDFAADVLGMTASISYMENVNAWSIQLGRAGGSTGRAAEFSTERMGADDIFKKLVRNQEIIVRDKDEDGKTYVNRVATDIAMDAARKMDKFFQRWALEDLDRRELIAKDFNEKVNTTIEGRFDGSHMIFPGMGIINAGQKRDDQLRQHQKNVVWRLIQKGKGLLDHVVGSGKTFAAIAAGIEMKRMGLANKPMYVVPNHLVEQWATDFQKLYPGANVLTITKKDFAKKRRQEFLGKIATGQWDAVLLAHSSFGFIQAPKEYEQRFYQEQVSQYEEAIQALAQEEGKKSRTVKQMEAARDRLKEKLKALADAPKDAVLDFSELGVDALFVDEAHEFKNLYYVTKKTGIAGLGNPTGSKKAFDMFVKTRYLQEQYNGKGVFFLTGTPVSNSIAEMYTMMRYLEYDRLADMGIKHFDQWANMFASVESDWQVDATGTRYKLQSQLTFQNLPGLMSFYKDFADVISTEDLKTWATEHGQVWPTPEIKGGAPKNVVAERSDLQASFMDWIVHRMDNMPIDPREDNPLKATGEAMKAALDIRLIDPSAPDFKGSKVNMAVDSIYDIYTRWTEKKGTQLVFCDLSVPKKSSSKIKKEIGGLRAEIARVEQQLENATDDKQVADLEAEHEKLTKKFGKYSYAELIAADSSFSVYDDIRAKLIEKGVAPSEIAFIHDANTDQQKEDLFGRVRSGQVRVLIGSTSKMGAGMNVQNKLVALHHLDAPWRPSDLEQREGRIIRQGNEFFEEELKKTGKKFEVEIFRYATKETLDTRRWQIIERKAKSIAQLRAGQHAWGESIEDAVGEAANAADMKAAASGNPLILKEIQLRQRINKLESLETGHRSKRYEAERNIAQAEKFLEQQDVYLQRVDEDAERIKNNPRDDTPEGWSITVNGKQYKAQNLQEVPEIPEETEANKQEVKEAREAAKKAEEANKEALKRAKKRAAKAIEDALNAGDGTIVHRGVEFEPAINRGWNFAALQSDLNSSLDIIYTMEAGKVVDFSGTGFYTRLNNLFQRVAENSGQRKDEINRQAGYYKENLSKWRKQVEKPFEHAEELEKARQEHAETLQELRSKKDEAPEETPDFSRWTSLAVRMEGAEAPNEGSRFARAEGRRVPKGAEVSKSILQKMMDVATGELYTGLKGKIEILNHESELPKALQDTIKAEDISGNWLGVFHEGKVYFVADNIATPDALAAAHMEWLLRHEGRHLALDQILGGKRQKQAFFGKVATRYKPEVNAFLKKHDIESTASNRAMAAEEVLVEKIKAGETGTLIDRFVAKVAAWARKLFPNMGLTKADIRQIISQADRLIEKGETGFVGRGVKADPRFVFAGKKANAADTSMLEKAKLAKQKGTASRERIWQVTGWWEIVPGQWSFEIDDSKVALSQRVDKATQSFQLFGLIYQQLQSKSGSLQLSEIIDAPKLFEAYPFLRQLNIAVLTSRGKGASYNDDYATISVGAQVPASELKSHLLHEIQHAVQATEGFARGGSVRDVLFDESLPETKLLVNGEDVLGTPLGYALLEGQPSLTSMRDSRKTVRFSAERKSRHIKGWQQKIKALEKEISKLKQKSAIQSRKNRIEELRDAIKKISKPGPMHIELINTPGGHYMRLAGEAEARLVQKRIDMTPAQRKAEPPWKTLEKMLREEQLLRKGQNPEDVLTTLYRDNRAGARFARADEAGAEAARRQDAREEWIEKGTRSKYFKKWFGDSKVVDDSGKPIVVYHGTTADFSAFAPSMEVDDIGFHFGNRYQAEARLEHKAQFRAAKEGRGFTTKAEDYTGVNMMPVYLSIKNPLVLPDSGTWGASSIATVMELKPKQIDSRLTKAQREKIKAIGYSERINKTPKLKEYLQGLGYDGIQYKNEHEGGGLSYIAFEPEQVKSATGNVGTFDPANSDIRFARTSVRPWPKNFSNATLHTSMSKLTGHPEYKKAKEQGDIEAGNRVARDLIKPEKVRALKKQYPDAIVVAAHAKEAKGRNTIPVAVSNVFADAGFAVDDSIVQTNRAERTKKDSPLRLVIRPEFAGEVQAGRKYIIVDDALGQGGTISELRHFIENNGGEVAAVSALTSGIYGSKIKPDAQIIKKIEDKHGRQQTEKFLRKYNIAGKLEALTNKEARYIARQPSLDGLRDRILAAAQAADIDPAAWQEQGPVREEVAPAENRDLTSPPDGTTPLVESKGTRFVRVPDYKPQKTVKAYKLLRTLKSKPGQVFPLFIGKNQPVAIGVWEKAEHIPTKGFAERPGWHAGAEPIAPHLRQKATGKIHPDRVWVEVEMPADKEWQSTADASKTRDIRDRVPEDGHYKFKTNKMQGGAWLIGGAVKINRVLDDGEVAQLLRDAGHSEAEIQAEMHDTPEVFERLDAGPEASFTYAADLPAHLKPSDYGAPVQRVQHSAAQIRRATWGEEKHQPKNPNKEFTHFLRTGDLPPNVTFGKEEKKMRVTQRSFMLPQWIAKYHPETFGRLYERTKKRIETRNDLNTKDAVSLDSFWKLRGEKLEAVRDVIWAIDGQDIKGVPDSLEVSKERGLHINEEAYPALEKWITENLGVSSDIAKEVVQVRRVLDSKWVQIDQLLARSSEVDKNLIDQFRKDARYKKNYFPHVRYGNHYIQIRDSEGAVVFRSHFDAKLNLSQRRAAAKELEKIFAQYPEYKNMKVKVGRVEKLPEESIYDTPIPTDAIMQILKTASQKAGPDMAHLFENALPEMVSDILKTRGFGAHTIHQNNIPGFEARDIQKVLHQYLTGANGWMTKMEASRDYSKILATLDAKKDPELYKASKNYVSDMLRNSDQHDRRIAWMKSAFFAKYLGASIKTPVLNLTQVIVAGTSRLSMETKKANMRYMGTTGKILVDALNGRKTLTTEQRRFLHDFYEKGLSGAQFTEEVSGQLMRDPVASGWDRFVKFLGIPMAISERFNRTTVGLAAFNIAREGKITNKKTLEKFNKKPGQPFSYDEAMEFAKEINTDTNFDFGRHNRPEVVRAEKSPAIRYIAGTGYTFRFFTHNLLSLWKWQWKQGGTGQRALMRSLAAVVAFGGLTSFPLYKTFMAAMRQLTGDDWEEKTVDKLLPDDEDMDWFRDLALYGIPTIAGTTMGSSMSMELPVLSRYRVDQSPTGQGARLFAEALGIPYSMLVDMERAVTAAYNRDPLRALESILPPVVANPLRAHRAYSEGLYTHTGRPIVLPGDYEPRRITGAEAIGQAFGFQPVTSQKSWEMTQKIGDLRAYKTRKQRDFANRIAKAVHEQDFREVRKIVREVAAWNREQARKGRFEYIIDLAHSVATRMQGRQPPKYLRPYAQQLRQRAGM